MITLFKRLPLHFLFILLIQIMYILVALFNPALIHSFWFYLYAGVCLFIYFGAGWTIMHETKSRLLALLAGAALFLAGYIVQFIAQLINLAWEHHLTWLTVLASVQKTFSIELYFAFIAMAVSSIAAHICSQYERHRPL